MKHLLGCLLLASAALVLAGDCRARAGEGASPQGPWKCHIIDDSSRGADGARLADVNGDGLIDITTG